ncbi:hypothetical protein CJD36_001240 [Flavipsychrobacter stenotrophus]|uniref:Uncharacterized protein n=1 Tax=Flavipsychrobacter stenotrophus TaxID=2077091 RepID=A0A2S7T0C2_9BACT|nr:hypothetical protein CJD36_001240 [Flavipsychrobacter stenotrophus]
MEDYGEQGIPYRSNEVNRLRSARGLGAVLIKNFVQIIDENQIEPQGYIIGAEIYYDKGYVQKK